MSCSFHMYPTPSMTQIQLFLTSFTRIFLPLLTFYSLHMYPPLSTSYMYPTPSTHILLPPLIFSYSQDLYPTPCTHILISPLISYSLHSYPTPSPLISYSLSTHILLPLHSYLTPLYSYITPSPFISYSLHSYLTPSSLISYSLFTHILLPLHSYLTPSTHILLLQVPLISYSLHSSSSAVSNFLHLYPTISDPSSNSQSIFLLYPPLQPIHLAINFIVKIHNIFVGTFLFFLPPIS